MDAQRVGLTTMLALAAVAAVASVTAGFAGVHAHGPGGLVWDVGGNLPFLAVGGYAYLTRPDHPTTQRMAAFAALLALQSALTPPLSTTPTDVTVPSDILTLGGAHMWVAHLAFHILTAGLIIVGTRLFALYPDGQVQTSTERWILRPMWALLVLPPIMLVGQSTLPPTYFEPFAVPGATPLFISWLEPIGDVAVSLLGVLPALLLVGIGLLVARFRRSGIDARQRIKWLLLPVGVTIAVTVVDAFGLVPETVFGAPADEVSFVPVLPAMAIALLLGVRQQRAGTADLVLRRSLVYGLLWVLIAGVYIAIAAGLGLAVSERFPVAVAILLTIGVTLAFQPARRWLEGLVDRWVFGARLTRYEALTRLGRLLEEAFDLDELLPHLARTVRMTLGLAWARIELADDGGAAVRTAAVDGDPGDDEAVFTVPVEFAGEHLGAIACGPRVRGSLGAPDLAVLEDLARQAALAIRNVRLAAQLADRVDLLRHRTDELAESRRRLVRAQEAERRRIERDLHDGIQQDLVALIGEVGRARARLDGSEPPVLGAMQDELARVLRDLRELAHGIHPQLLADRGLLEAVQVRARRCPVPVAVRASRDLHTTRFPVEVEGAAYFTVCEALANMLKHAHATRGEVRLEHRDGWLVVDVSDDGVGPGADGVGTRGDGQGLGNLTERLAALDGTLRVTRHDDGGTLLHAELPVVEIAEPSRG